MSHRITIEVMAHDVLPITCLGGEGYQLEIRDVPSNCGSRLVTKQQPLERKSLTLPILGYRLEANILSEHHATQVPSALQDLVIEFPVEAVFNGCEDIDPAPAKLFHNRHRNVDVHIQSHRHLTCSMGPKPKNDG